MTDSMEMETRREGPSALPGGNPQGGSARLSWVLRGCMSLSCILADHRDCIRGPEGCDCECHRIARLRHDYA
jgi:hypothetical protein